MDTNSNCPIWKPSLLKSVAISTRPKKKLNKTLSNTHLWCSRYTINIATTCDSYHTSLTIFSVMVSYGVIPIIVLFRLYSTKQLLQFSGTTFIIFLLIINSCLLPQKRHRMHNLAENPNKTAWFDKSVFPIESQRLVVRRKSRKQDLSSKK